MFISRKKSGKKEYLYHIQNMNICSDGNPYDVFLWCDHEPTAEDLRKVFLDDYACEENDPYIDEFMMSSDIWKVYVHDSSVLRKKTIDVECVKDDEGSVIVKTL